MDVDDAANRIVRVDETSILGAMALFGGHEHSGMWGEDGAEGLSEFAHTRSTMARA